MSTITVASFEESARAHRAAQALEDGGFPKQEISLQAFDPDTALGDPADGVQPMDDGVLKNRESLVMITSDDEPRASAAARILARFQPREIVSKEVERGRLDIVADSVSVSAAGSLDGSAEEADCVPRAPDGKFAECDSALAE